MKVLHLARWMNYGGSERVILNLCKYSKAQSAVICVQDGDFRKEFEQPGIPLTITESKREILRQAMLFDIVNIHWYFKDISSMFYFWNIPQVITLHGNFILPKMPCPIISVARHVALKQYPYNCVITIHNGVDTSKFSFSFKKRREKVILIRVCRPDKCATYFWSCIDKVLKASPDVELWIVGEEGESSNRIKFLGVCDNVPDILSQADIFVYTPIPRGGAFDLVILEAMSAGLPIVTTDVAHVREAMVNNKTGYLVPFNDESAFVDAVIRLVDDFELRHRMGNYAATLVRKKFDIRQVANRYDRVYEKLLKRLV